MNPEDYIKSFGKTVIKWFLGIIGPKVLLIFLIVVMIASLISWTGNLLNLTGDDDTRASVKKLNESLMKQYQDTSGSWKTTSMERTIIRLNGNVEHVSTPLSANEIDQAQSLRVGLSWGLLASVDKLYNDFHPPVDKEDVRSIGPLLPKWQEVATYKTVTEKDANGNQITSKTVTEDVHEVPLEISTYAGTQSFHVEYKQEGDAKEPFLLPDAFKADYGRLDALLKKRALSQDLDLVLVLAHSLDSTFMDPKLSNSMSAFGLHIDVGGWNSSDPIGDIGFSGSYNGFYSMDYDVTKDSGVSEKQIAAILRGTPMEGDAPFFIQYGKKYGIDPAFLVGVAGSEQGFDPYYHNAFGITGVGDAGSVLVPSTGAILAVFSDDEQNIRAAAKLLSGNLYVGRGHKTIREIWHVWAPGEAENDPQGLNANWARNVIITMNRLK